jgi:CheY-like chemotaxis protein
MNECRRVLVVDDDVTQRELLITLLISMDYEVNAVATGNEALESIRQCVPALVLLDIGLPDIDGLEVMDKMASIPDTEDLIVILISGSADTGGVLRAQQLEYLKDLMEDLGFETSDHDPVLLTVSAR